MLKNVLIFLIVSFSLYSTELPFQNLIDLGKYPKIDNGYISNGHYSHFDLEAWTLGQYAFNYAPELTPFFAYLKNKYQIDTIIETGTFLGGTTVLFSYLFDKVYTIEINKHYYDITQTLFADYPSIYSFLGNSGEVLQTILPTLQGKRVLFYLDAHWEDYCPLLDELKVIANTHANNCIIIIDDMKVPGRKDIPFDNYNNKDFSLEYVKGKLDRIFTSYKYHYLIPRNVKSRAKLVVIPSNF